MDWERIVSPAFSPRPEEFTPPKTASPPFAVLAHKVPPASLETVGRALSNDLLFVANIMSNHLVDFESHAPSAVDMIVDSVGAPDPEVTFRPLPFA